MKKEKKEPYSVKDFLKYCYASNIKPWLFDFKCCYATEKNFEKSTHLKNELKYKEGKLKEKSDFNVTGKTGVNADCDKEAFPLYKALGWQDKPTYITRGETMNTFITTFKHAIKKSDNAKDVYKKIEIDPEERLKKQYNKLYENEAYLNEFSLIGENIKLFQEFAALNHTLGNFTVLPHWMNTGRYNFSKDYWDLTLRSLYYFFKTFDESDTSWRAFIDTYYLNVYVNDNYKPIEFWKKHFEPYRKKYPVLPKTKEQINAFLKRVNNAIEVRGKILTKVLCEKLKEEDYYFYENELIGYDFYKETEKQETKVVGQNI